jgi:hypothetical protein
MFRVALRTRSVFVVSGCVLLLAVGGCDYLAGAMPPTPSPFPTVARLPSVTPVTPSPIPPPTNTPRPTLTPTVAPEELEGTVSVGANVRNGPGTQFPAISSVLAGRTVIITGRSEGWYAVITSDGTEGWMSELVIETEPLVATAVPTVVP